MLRLRTEEAFAWMRRLFGLLDATPDHVFVSSEDGAVQRLLARMSEREKRRLLWGYMGSGVVAPCAARPGSVGYVPGNSRLGIPPQWQTDGGLGVATQPHTGVRREFTAMPSGLALAASWDEDLARRVGAAVGREAAASGHNVLLGGAVNLVRDPRSGRAFEMAGEDPLLAGRMVGAQVIGVQSNPVICTVKHFALNNQEAGRHYANVLVDEAEARMSDLLAFQIAIETGAPKAVMCAYNRVNGVPSSENRNLLDRLLRAEWGWDGYVMSDWGGVHSSVEAARAGLDQQSAASLDERTYFDGSLQRAVSRGELPHDQLDRMAGRILRVLLDDGMGAAAVLRDTEVLAHERLAQEVAENGAVLLTNHGAMLPLSVGAGTIALIGRHAEFGVLSGGGSSQVYARGGLPRGRGYGRSARKSEWPAVIHPSSPLAAIRAKLPSGQVRHEDGCDLQSAVQAAETSDVAIIIASQWSTEGRDNDFGLPCEQDALIEAVAAVNPNTIVVLETGGAVAMPWSEKVRAILQLWYPGCRGGSVLADLLFGEVNPAGRLPISIPRTSDQLPRPRFPGADLPPGEPFDLPYVEGAAVGYKWFERTGQAPLFPFGHGLSFTHFKYRDLEVVDNGDRVRVRFGVSNEGERGGTATPQVYALPLSTAWEAPKRLVGWSRVELAPGTEKTVTVEVDPRLLALFDTSDGGWRIDAGDYLLVVGESSRDEQLRLEVQLGNRVLPGGWKWSPQ